MAKTAAQSKQPSALFEKAAPPTKLDILQDLVTREGGATLDDMMAATRWQKHSVRGALSGALKKRGVVIVSEKVDGIRTYAGTLTS